MENEGENGPRNSVEKPGKQRTNHKGTINLGSNLSENSVKTRFIRVYQPTVVKTR